MAGMDGSVIFDNNQSSSEDQAGNSQGGAAQPPQAQDPNTQPVATAVPEDASTGGVSEVPVDGSQPPGEVPPDETQPGEAQPEDPPPPNPLKGILIKIGIGIGVLLLIIVLIMVFMPKKQVVKNVKLLWWGLWEDGKTTQVLIEDFQRTHPNIKVEYVMQTPDLYRDRLSTRIMNGNNAPDIFRYHNTWLPMLRDLLLPIPSDVITPEEYETTYYPVIQKDLIQNGGIYGVPLGVDTLALFVNTEILKDAGVEVPRDWTEFQIAARKLTIKDKVTGRIKTAGAAMGTYANITHAPDVISLLFIQQGIDMSKFPLQAQSEMDALKFYVDFAQGEQSVWDSSLDESILAFSKGNLAMYFGYSWDIFRIQALSKNNIPFKIYPVPGISGGNNPTIASYWVEGVSSRSPNQKEALEFLKFLSQKEAAQKFYSEQAKTRAFGEPYARKDLADSLKSNELVYPFLSQMENAASTPFSSDTKDGEGGLNYGLNNYLGNAINSLVTDNTSLDTVVQTLDAGVQQVYDNYQIK